MRNIICHLISCHLSFMYEGGAIVPLQTGGQMYFARAVILAIYADHPAARKCTLTGSACPVCYTPQNKMAALVQEPRHALHRTPHNMRVRKRVLERMASGPTAKAKERAVKKSKQLGVNLDVPNAWCDRVPTTYNWIFGPDERVDNVWQCTPQVHVAFITYHLSSIICHLSSSL
jgi:hypothetical protein